MIRFNPVRSLALAFGLALALSPLAFGQDSNQTTNAQNDASRARSVSSGQQMKIKGVVVHRDPDTFTVRDINGVDTLVRLTDWTSVKTNGGFLRSGTNYGATNILRGLNLEVEGRGGSNGELVADKVRFNESDLRTARAVEARATPLENRASAAEGRLSEVEQNAQKLSGQLDELAAVSNAARGGAKAAQESADAAIAGVNATNYRISALDDYVPQDSIAVNFRLGSAVLSQRRAEAVIRYLVEQHQIPLRRIVTPYGFGASEPVADNKTRTGRAENRRVEVKILVNKCLMQPAPTMTKPGDSGQ